MCTICYLYRVNRRTNDFTEAFADTPTLSKHPKASPRPSANVGRMLERLRGGMVSW